MTEPPPSRYRVVERGLRLEVIDRHSGERVGRALPVSAPEQQRTIVRLSLPRQVRFDGGAEWKTYRLFDDKGPRTVQLDPGSAALVRGAALAAAAALVMFIAAAIAWHWLALALVVPFQRDVRRPIRAAATRWLDRVDREAQ